MRRVSWQVPMAVVLLSGFIGLGFIACMAPTGTAVDHRVLDWIVGQRTAGLTGMATFITVLGSPAAIALIAVGAAALIWSGRAQPAPRSWWWPRLGSRLW